MLELTLVELPADGPERARRFWEGLVGRPFAEGSPFGPTRRPGLEHD
jgi:hypothetical protein